MLIDFFQYIEWQKPLDRDVLDEIFGFPRRPPAPPSPPPASTIKIGGRVHKAVSPTLAGPLAIARK